MICTTENYHMTTQMRFVVDTHAIIWHFTRAFGQVNCNSATVNSILTETLEDESSKYRLIVPAIAFVEIFDKFSTSKESSRRVFYECFTPLRHCDRIELRELDHEVLETVSQISGELESHEVNDKIIVATAAVLSAPILTKDPKIHKYAAETAGCKVIW